MQMTDGEIVRSFLESADKKAQVGILAQLNACDEDEIVQILERDARVKPNMLHGWKISRSMKERRKQRESDRKAQEAQALQEAKMKRELNACSAPPCGRSRGCTESVLHAA